MDDPEPQDFMHVFTCEVNVKILPINDRPAKNQISTKNHDHLRLESYRENETRAKSPPSQGSKKGILTRFAYYPRFEVRVSLRESFGVWLWS